MSAVSSLSSHTHTPLLFLPSAHTLGTYLLSNKDNADDDDGSSEEQDCGSKLGSDHPANGDKPGLVPLPKAYDCIGPKHFMLWDEFASRYVTKDSVELAAFRKKHNKTPLRHDCARKLRASKIPETANLRQQLERANR